MAVKMNFLAQASLSNSLCSLESSFNLFRQFITIQPDLQLQRSSTYPE